MERTIKVLDPTAKSRIEEIKMSAPAHDLNGKVIGFMWNHKPNGDILLLRIKEELNRRYKLAGTIWKHWEGGGSGPEASIIEEIAAADMVVVAIGDWGGCTTWCIHASVSLQKKGIPTVTVCSDRFEFLAKYSAKSLGMPDLPLVIVPHPIGGLSPEEVKAKADGIVDAVIARLTGQ